MSEASAQPASVTWQGRMRCDAMPGITTIPLDIAFTLTVTGDMARYTRPVMQADSRQTSGRAETGSGRVAADGAVTLRGSAEGAEYRYTATYQGRLPPGGGAARLVGTQDWVIPTRNVATRRPCTIELRRG